MFNDLKLKLILELIIEIVFIWSYGQLMLMDNILYYMELLL